MAIENFKSDDSLKKKEKLSESEQKKEIADRLEFNKEKEKLLRLIEKDRKLAMLKSIVERGLLRPDIVKRIINGENLDLGEITEVLKKIDEISSIEKVDMILPIELRVSKEEYLNALGDETEREQLIKKIDRALDHLYLLSNPNSGSVYDMFSGLLLILNRNLVKVQDNTIDIKLSLLSK